MISSLASKLKVTVQCSLVMAGSAEGLIKFQHLISPHLKRGETIRYIASAKPVKAITPVGLSGLGAEIGTAIAKAGAVKGGSDTIAASLPQQLPLGRLCLLCVTDQRLLFLVADPARKKAELLWSLSTSEITGIDKKLRLQIMAKFAVHFTDNSAVSFATFRKRTIQGLAQQLGWWRK